MHISRYALVFGKILGESLVAFAQVVVIVTFAAVIGVQVHWTMLPSLLFVGFVTCLLGDIFLHRLMLDYFAANETTEPGRSLPCGHEQHTPSARFCSVCGAAVPSPFLP